MDDLAARTGIHKTTISRLEAGIGNPTLNTVQRLERAFGVRRGTIRFVLRPTPRPGPVASAPVAAAPVASVPHPPDLEQAS